MPRAAFAHVRQQPDDQLHGAEIVDLHRAFEVMEALVAQRDRAADGAPGVVDEHVDIAVVGQHPLQKALDRVRVGDVGGVHVCRPAGGDDFRPHLLELLDVAGDEQGNAARRREFDRRSAPDPR